MFNLIKPVDVRCRNCQHVGKSKINNYYRAVCFLLLALAVLGVLLPKVNLGLSLTRNGWIQEVIWFLPLVAAVGVYIAPNAHTCEKCKSTFLREVG